MVSGLRLLSLPLLLGLLLLAGCVQTGLARPTPVTLTLAGSTEMRPVLVELTQAYSARYPNVDFQIRGGGSTLGEEWLAQGRIDLAASTRISSPETIPSGLHRIPVALDGIAIVVHPSNPVDALTLLQLRDLYSGRVLDWADVGGEPGEIRLVSREDGSGTRALFEARVMGQEPVSLTAVVMPTSWDVVDYVAGHPQAIGYVSMAYTRSDALEGRGVKVLALEGRLPTPEQIRDRGYHLARPLFLLRRSEDSGPAREFTDFVLSGPGQAIVARYHVPVR